MKALRLFGAAVLLTLSPACFQAEATEHKVAQAPSGQSQSVCNLIPTDGMPKMAGRVTDAAGVLSAEDIQILTDLSAKVEAETKVQMAFVTVPSIGEATAADYTCTLGNLWGIGDKERDDGVTILVAVEERQVRISVGHGLEVELTEEKLQPIVHNAIALYFRRHEFGAGMESMGKGTLRLLKER